MIDFIVYKLKIYRLLPWEYGGRRIFQWPTRVWIKRDWKKYHNENSKDKKDR